MPLLLSPAGSMQALKSAIDAGADEIYLGGSDFNARINATNFDRDALIKASNLCRNANVGLNITLNTLVYDKEFKKALEYVDFLANKVRPNGIIVQDLGLATAIREQFPNLPLHASTQMRIHSYLDAEYLKNLGFTRAVLARELPLEDIQNFVKTGLETEIFVHGAICVSESGGCLMSSVIGNRSGNRGQCAQPCRLPCKGKEKYPLSPKDMCLATRITDIIQSGVTSLKIEGRMKSPEYVGGVTSIYRKLLDENRNATQKELNLLSDIFSRSGFTSGYFDGKITKSMFGVRTEEDKKRTENLRYNIPKAEKRKELPYYPMPEKFVIPQRNDEITQHPREQKGFVLRFEGDVPSQAFLEKYVPLAARIDVPIYNCFDKKLANYADKISIILPRSIFVKELPSIKEQIKKAYESGIRHATVSNLYQMDLCKGFFIHGDYSLNVINRKTLELLENYSFSSVMLSPETDGNFAKGSKCALEYIGYGRTPLMYTRTCIIQNIGDCQHKTRCFGILTDRTGAKFPIISGSNHTNTIYNSVPRYHLDRKSELKKSGVGLLTLLFTDEPEYRMEEVISLFSTKEKPKFEYTRK